MASDSSDVSIIVTWDMPMDIDIDKYRIQYRDIDQSNYWVAFTVDGSLTSYEIIGLSPLTTYTAKNVWISNNIKHLERYWK